MRARASIPEAKMQMDASLLEPPGHDERAIYVRPGDAPADVLTRGSARLSQGRRRLSAGVRTGGPVIDHENRPLIGLSVTEPARAVVYVARTFRCAMRAITDRGKNR